MPSKNEMLADELKTLVDDLKQVFVTLTTDQKEQRRKELQWRILYGGLSAVFAIGARKVATKGWGILTGEEPPRRRAAIQSALRPEREEKPGEKREEETELVSVPTSEQETVVGA